MKRNEMGYLRRWKLSNDRKPLIIRGARQVGKTWLMKEFGRSEYTRTAYLNFESTPALKGLFTEDFNIRRILTAIRIETGMEVEKERTLIVLDEIQEASGGLTALKYFYENAPEYHIVSAGSLLGVALGNQQSFPVGKVDFLDLHPLDYTEFLEAIGEGSLAELLRSHDWTLIQNYSARFIDYLKQYYYVGGMPEAVLAFSKTGDFNAVREIQRRILLSYDQDFSKHAPNAIVPRIRMVWNSIPAQLAKENRKFIYGIIRQGARAKDYELALAWLVDCGLVYQVNNVTKPVVPLKAYEEFGTFKLFTVDIGLLSAMSNLDVRSLLGETAALEEFKGALTEQYVLQQLVAQKEANIYYWSPDNSRAEVDFLLQVRDKIIPLEVKAAENVKSKSLHVYFDKFKPEFAFRTSLSHYRRQEWMTNLPLYAIHELVKLI